MRPLRVGFISQFFAATLPTTSDPPLVKDERPLFDLVRIGGSV